MNIAHKEEKWIKGKKYIGTIYTLNDSVAPENNQFEAAIESEGNEKVSKPCENIFEAKKALNEAWSAIELAK